MHPNIIETCLIILSVFGGIAGVIAANGWAKAEQRRASGKAPGAPQYALVAELNALKHQVAEMQSTGHEFDLSFDATLSRLECRVDRLETKAVPQAAITSTAEASLRNGHG